jgi:hypothetical protein
MHARELVELAAIVSAHGPVLIRTGEPVSIDSIEQYWAASKVRLDRWAWRLKGFGDEVKPGARPRSDQCSAIRGVLEEILTGEILTRVWTAVLCAYDRHHHTDRAEPAARSVMIGHMEARHRVLCLLAREPNIDPEAAMKFDRLRRLAERWTDLLVGYLAHLHDVSEFAFDPWRAADFAGDLQYRTCLPGGRHVWPLLLASVHSAFQQGLAPHSPNADLNTRIAASILSCFSTDLFDSTGLLRSLWLMRLTSMADDAQGKIDDLLRPQRTTATQRTPSTVDLPSGRRLFGR